MNAPWYERQSNVRDLAAYLADAGVLLYAAQVIEFWDAPWKWDVEWREMLACESADEAINERELMERERVA